MSSGCLNNFLQKNDKFAYADRRVHCWQRTSPNLIMPS